MTTSLPQARLRRAARAALALGATLAFALGAAAPAAAQVSINVGQPGFYGQLNIGGFPPPVLYSPQPVVIERQYVGAPVYLRVPPGHRRHWAQHCGRYNACGRQVYFVQDSWYSNTYVPRYREGHYRERPVVRENFYREAPRPQLHDERREHMRDERRDEHGGGHDRGREHGNEGRGDGNGRGRHGD
ncbi:hypothetical protein [Massilia sp. PWRC2]|uniref:hypothetical protein n=1 Tax=Massilia sp. PWRC2 TaxID=2804626 RepID=UPI003CEBF8BD